MTRKPLGTLAALTFGLVFLLGQAVAAAPAPQAYKVHNIDVGQGAATLVQTLGGKNILIDTGWDFAGDRLVAYLNKAGIKKIDTLVITHRHMDHIGGVEKVAAAFPVGKVIGPWQKNAIPISAMSHLAHLRKSMTKANGPSNRPDYEGAKTGKVFDYGHGFKMETLWPKVPTSGKRIGDFNEESVTLRITQKAPRGGESSFLVGGDLGVKEERYLARTMPKKLKVDWIVANHHGSAGSSQREFMVAADGGYSPMLKALIDGDTRSPIGKTANQLKNYGRGKLAGTVMKHMDPLNKNPPKIGAPWLKKMIQDIKTLSTTSEARNGRYAIYSVGPNAYGHPNATRMSEALLAGFTPITTWANGTVVMNRTIDKNGNWDGNWKPSAVSSKDLPKAITPKWLGHRDPEKPYDGTAREANYQWSLNNPHREVDWNSAWDTSKTWRMTSRELATGRRAWLEEYSAAKKQATSGVKDGVEPRNEREKTANMTAGARKLKSMQYKGKVAWHGLKLDSMRELDKPELQQVANGRRPRTRKASNAPALDAIATAHLTGGHTAAKTTTTTATTKTQSPRARTVHTRATRRRTATTARRMSSNMRSSTTPTRTRTRTRTARR